MPGAVTEEGFAWHLLSGANGHRDGAALATQHLSVNIDPSDRYVLSVPGSDKYRLRPTKAATTTSSSLVTGPTRASTPVASSRPSFRVCRRPIACSATAATTGFAVSTCRSENHRPTVVSKPRNIDLTQ